MTKSQRVAPVTAAELRAVFEIAGITAEWFCEATGADKRRVRRWLSGAESDVPLWAATFALALCTAEAQASVRTWLAKHREPGRPQPAQSAPQETQSLEPFAVEVRRRGRGWFCHAGGFAYASRAHRCAEDVATTFKCETRVVDRLGSVVARARSA